MVITALLGTWTSVYASSDIEYDNPETNYAVKIIDESDILSDSEAEELLEHMKKITEYGHAVFYTLDDNAETCEEACENKYLEYFYEDETGVIFTFDFDNREMYLMTFGDFFYNISEGDITALISRTSGYSSEGDYFKSAEYTYDEFYKLVEEYNNPDYFEDGDSETESSPARQAEPVTYKNEATGYEVRILDEADLLSDSEEKKLMEEMMPITEYANAVFDSTNTSRGNWETAAKKKLVELYGSDSVNSTIFYIDMANRQLTVAATGNSVTPYLTGSKCDTITDNVYRDASKGDYYSCAAEAYREMYTILNGGKIAEPMRIVSNVFLAIVVGLLIAYGIVRAFTTVRKPSEKELLAAINVKQNLNNYNCVFTHTTRVYDPPSSSSSGGGGGGGGGGGSSSSGSHGF
jgi:hypothetical protein